eukprot:3905762-Pyramimonas_sp.AAC.1
MPGRPNAVPTRPIPSQHNLPCPSNLSDLRSNTLFHSHSGSPRDPHNSTFSGRARITPLGRYYTEAMPQGRTDLTAADRATPSSPSALAHSSPSPAAEY